MKDLLKKYWWVFLLFLIVVPVIVEIGITIIPLNGSDDGWLGFWGGYLGATVSIIGVYWSVNKQISFEKSLEKERNKPILVPISEDFGDLHVTADLKKFTNPNESYGNLDRFSDLFFTLVNGSSKNIYDIRCKFTIANLDRLKSMYNSRLEKNKKCVPIIGSDKAYISINEDGEIVFYFMNGSGFTTLRKQDAVYTISYIGAGDLKKVRVPATIYPFLKTYVFFVLKNRRPFMTNVKNILPFYKVNLSYKDYKLQEHNITFELNFNKIIYKGNPFQMSNCYVSLNIKPENIDNVN